MMAALFLTDDIAVSFIRDETTYNFQIYNEIMQEEESKSYDCGNRDVANTGILDFNHPITAELESYEHCDREKQKKMARCRTYSIYLSFCSIICCMWCISVPAILLAMTNINEQAASTDLYKVAILVSSLAIVFGFLIISLLSFVILTSWL